MSRRKSVENPFLRVILAEQDKRKEPADSEVEISVRPEDSEVGELPKPYVLQINGDLINQLNYLTENLKESMPLELHPEFGIETMNELTIAYLISDFRAHSDGKSIAERLSQGWAKVIEADEIKKQ